VMNLAGNRRRERSRRGRRVKEESESDATRRGVQVAGDKRSKFEGVKIRPALV
jgi:hypothetical protein